MLVSDKLRKITLLQSSAFIDVAAARRADSLTVDEINQQVLGFASLRCSELCVCLNAADAIKFRLHLS